jgi:MoxR-like ATPase
VLRQFCGFRVADFASTANSIATNRVTPALSTQQVEYTAMIEDVFPRPPEPPAPHDAELNSADLDSNVDERDLDLAKQLVRAYRRLTTEIGKRIVGQSEVLEQLLIAVLARGHCLLEGVPGLAKTLMVRSLADAVDLSFRRIQFTPDLMPADITGTDIIQEDSGTGARQLVFEKGPIFAQMILADEINRTPPKTQAALLEAMQEHSVTVGGRTYELDEPFFVLATQNPIEQEGTYPLPEAQRDRFLFHVRVDYPTRDQERQILEQTTGAVTEELQAVLTGQQIVACQRIVRRVPTPDHVYEFVLDLVRMSRPRESEAPPLVREFVEWGPGPRAAQCLISSGKVRALLRGRYHVTIDDIEALALPVLRHRIVPTFSAEAQGYTVDQIVGEILAAAPRGAANALV